MLARISRRNDCRCLAPGVVKLFATALLGLLPLSAVADPGSRLLATGGVTQVEGAAGGGLVPWAVLSGYGRESEVGGEIFATWSVTDDYALGALGASVAIGNRVELSVATQILDIDDLADDLGLPDDTLRQNVVGMKVRLFGDLVYGDLPQVSAGIQYKENTDFDVPGIAGARDDEDFDIYLAATRLWLNGIAGYPVLLNVAVRHSRANQLGLLGFGGDLDNDREFLFEGSVGILLRRDLVIGYEYRQKPDNLGFADEDDWHDAFLAWFPNKHLSLTGAWVDLGSVAGRSGQDGFYFSIEGSY